MDLPFLLKVDKYYILNSFPDTYCIKCNRLEQKYICKKCGILENKIEEIVIYNKDKYNNIYNKYNNFFDNSNIQLYINNCMLEIQNIINLINNYNQQLNYLRNQFKA